MPDVRQTARERLARERGVTTKDWGNRIPVALVYPNTYYIGMSNLAMQTVYALFNAYPDLVCERAFVDPPTKGTRQSEPVVSLESQRSLSDFAVVGFTLSYEFDYFNMVQALKRSGMPMVASKTCGPASSVARCTVSGLRSSSTWRFSMNMPSSTRKV